MGGGQGAGVIASAWWTKPGAPVAGAIDTRLVNVSEYVTVGKPPVHPGWRKRATPSVSSGRGRQRQTRLAGAP